VTAALNNLTNPAEFRRGSVIRTEERTALWGRAAGDENFLADPETLVNEWFQ
jgi:hypothetical protein